jgi:hypothetical protein
MGASLAMGIHVGLKPKGTFAAANSDHKCTLLAIQVEDTLAPSAKARSPPVGTWCHVEDIDAIEVTSTPEDEAAVCVAFGSPIASWPNIAAALR